MAANLPALYAEAWTVPRQSMRRILSLGLSERDRIIMVAITGVLFAIPVGLVFQSIEMPVGPDGVQIPTPSALNIAIMVVGIVILSYYLTAALIKGVGSLFGGTGSYVECKAAAAWTQFIVGIANLAVMVLSFALPDAIDSVLRLIFTVAALYVSSAYIAEAHGFGSVGKVIGVSFAITMLLLLLLAPMLPAEMLQAQ